MIDELFAETPVKTHSVPIVKDLFESRGIYIEKLVNRLRFIPQLLTPNSIYSARSRYMHSVNVSEIVRKASFDPDESYLSMALARAAMLHDIGHARWGHCSERAINSWLGGQFYCNDRQSSRLLFYYNRNPTIDANIYSTKPLEHITGFVRWSLLENASDQVIPIDDHHSLALGASKIPVLEFIDDLENAIGDSGDLIRNKLCAPSRLHRELGIEQEFPVTETANVVISVLKRFGYNGKIGSLIEISTGLSDFYSIIRAVRMQIRSMHGVISEIQSLDKLGFDRTIRLCDIISSRYGQPDEIGIERFIDNVTSI